MADSSHGLPEPFQAPKESPEFWGRPRRHRSEATRNVLAAAGFLLVIAVLVVIASFALMFVNQSRIESVTRDYFRALGRGDGASAYRLLCEEAQQRTSEAELPALLPTDRRPVSVSGFTSATGADTPMPWDRQGEAWVNLKMGDFTRQPHIEMRNEGGLFFDSGWKVCPPAALDGGV